MAMASAPFSGADAIAMGFADHYVPHADVEAFRRAVVAALFGVLALMLGIFVLAMFGVGGGAGLGLRSGGPLAMVIERLS
ncbi:hypothetical protein MAHJHV35_46980 [Mycobacterium avium subsp. hominissuis]